MRDFGFIIHYLKLNIVRDRKARTIYFTQTAAIDRILEEIGIIEYSFCTTLIKSDL
jgi:hypothetical protein